MCVVDSPRRHAAVGTSSFESFHFPSVERLFSKKHPRKQPFGTCSPFHTELLPYLPGKWHQYITLQHLLEVILAVGLVQQGVFLFPQVLPELFLWLLPLPTEVISEHILGVFTTSLIKDEAFKVQLSS